MPQAFSVDDLYLHKRITELHTVRGKEVAACTVRSVDRENDKYTSCIWAFPLDGSPPRQLTQGPGTDNMPRWSPDGQRLAFTSDRGGSVQLYVLDEAGGEARQVGQLDGAPASPRWSPDGRHLYFGKPCHVDPDWRGQRGQNPKPRGPKAPEVAWKLPYKSDGLGYMLAREIHLFCMDAASGQAKQLTDGPFDVLAFDPSPNGKHIAFVRTREGRFSHATDLWVCDAGGGNARQLTREFSMVMQPLWSPDGRWILFSGSEDEGDALSYLWLLEFATGEVTQLGDDSALLSAPDTAHWAADSQSLIFGRVHRGRHEIAKISVPGGEITVLNRADRQLGALGLTGTHFAFTGDTPVAPSELHCCKADGSGERRVSNLNPWWDDRPRLEMKAREFQVPDGKGGTETIQGWLLHEEGAQGPMPLLNGAGRSGTPTSSRRRSSWHR
ncbi:TolB family protein [Ramlibacter albus]|uniref:PD40 domain-containing protein n=1 Tax=Ramlibacter albus TaxID=2079448 RepID=A0A923M968_9BURK|nr:PD40 domain-containing protein [Ramlibacter albus]MBC5766128.1 PD40 domain-containing protein [Ramlibacter albus]